MKIGTNFTEWLGQKLETAENLRVIDVDAPSTGLSAETALVTVSYEDPQPITEKLVIRAGPRTRGIFPEYSLETQAGVMRALHKTPVPVPNVRWYEPDPSVIGTAFLVMDFIEGVVPSDTPPGFHGTGLYHDATLEERVALWRAGLEKLALLHSLDWTTLDLPPLPGMAARVGDSIQDHITLLERWMDWGNAHQLEPIKKGMEWLRRTPVPSSRTALLWCDGRPGNILHRDGRPIALLDWELACIGIPEFDLLYWHWSAELLADVNDLPKLQGIDRLSDTISLYETFAGKSDPAAIDYAEKYILLRIALMNVLGIRVAVSDVYTEDYLLDNKIVRALMARLSG